MLTFNSKHITDLLNQKINKKFYNEASDLVALIHFADSGVTDPSDQQVCDILLDYEKRYTKLLDKIDSALSDYSFRQYMIIDKDGLLSIIICPFRADPNMKPIITDKPRKKGYTIFIDRNFPIPDKLIIQRN